MTQLRREKTAQKKDFVGENMNPTAQDRHLVRENNDLTVQNSHLVGENINSTAQNRHLVGENMNPTTQDRHLVGKNMNPTVQNRHLVCEHLNPTVQNTHLVGENTNTTAQQNNVSQLLQCTFCNHIFTRISELRHHVVIHSKPGCYPCVLCEDVFHVKLDLLKHWKLIHSGVFESVVKVEENHWNAVTRETMFSKVSE